MFIGFLYILAFSNPFGTRLPPVAPPLGVPTPGWSISSYEIDTNLVVCEFVVQGEVCHTEQLNASFISTGRIMLYYYCRHFGWGYEPYYVQVRYERSPTGRYRAEIKATRIRDPDTLTLRGWGDDPNAALRAAHSSAFITPPMGAP